MWVILPMGSVLAIIIFILLVLISIGIFIGTFIKVILFYLVAIPGFLFGIYYIVYTIWGIFSSEIEKKYLPPIFFCGVSLILIIKFPSIIVDCTQYNTGNAFLWWALVDIIILILGYVLSTQSYDEIISSKLVILFSFSSFLLFCSAVFVNLWLVGSKYYYYTERSDNNSGKAISYVVTEKEISLYKNKKKYLEDNELLGTYEKGTILEVKEFFSPILIFMGENTDYHKIPSDDIFERLFGWITPDDYDGKGEHQLIAFWGKFKSPDGKIGYVAIYGDYADTLKVNEKMTMSDEYLKKRPDFINKTAIALYDTIDLFGYKTYQQSQKTAI